MGAAHLEETVFISTHTPGDSEGHEEEPQRRTVPTPTDKPVGGNELTDSEDEWDLFGSELSDHGLDPYIAVLHGTQEWPAEHQAVAIPVAVHGSLRLASQFQCCGGH